MTAQRTDVLIIGTGFAGLGMAITLKQAGLDDFILLERDPALGGTWWANRYPGAACDVESHLYSFSFEPNPRWSHMFARQPEILAYLEHCADKYAVRQKIRFDAAAKSARWDAERALWTVVTHDGRVFEARAVVTGTGGLSTPSVPDLPGLASFAGRTFHSARWDHDCPLAGKAVGVIGTGASSIQIVPEIAPEARKLLVFQRTPPWIIPRPDRPIGAWEQRLFERVPFAQKLARGSIYLQREFLKGSAFTLTPKMLELGSLLAKKHLRDQVRDPELRRKLTPDYAFGCKRILLSSDYYPALQRPNVQLVTEGIERVTERGVLTTDGVEHPLDAIVLATGFTIGEGGWSYDVVGSGGLTLASAWKAGAEAYLGSTVAGFPNLFMLVGPNVGLGHSSMIYMIESQIAYVMGALRAMRERRIDAVEVRSEVQAAYNRELHGRLSKTVWASGCKSWYVSASGKNSALFPGYTFEFRRRTSRFDIESYRAHHAVPAAFSAGPAVSQRAGASQ